MDSSPSRAGGDAGFALIEALMSAIVLAVVSLAVLAGIEGATSSTARERSRSVAAALAEQDQERMRAMSAEQLADWTDNPPANRTVTVKGVDFTVQSTTRWIIDKTGGTASCVNNSASVDYLQIQTKVTSSLVGKRIAPVEMSSLVAPPVSKAKGTLAVQVNNRDSVGISGLTVNATSKTDGSTLVAEQTNALGCAIFINVPADSYTVTLNQTGYVDAFGNSPGQSDAEVLNGTVRLITMKWDQAGAANWSLSTTDPFAGTTTSLTSGAPRKLDTDTGTWVSSGVSATDPDEPDLLRSFQTSPATNLFPFLSPYSFFSGGCRQSNPQTYDSTYTGGSVAVGRNQVAPPASVAITQPPLGMRLKVSGSYYDGAVVFATLRQASGDDCSEMYRLTSIKRSGNSGYLTQYTGAGSPPYNPGLPFGV